MPTSSRVEDLIRRAREGLGYVEKASVRDRGELAEKHLRKLINELIDLAAGFREKGNGDDDG